MGVVPPTFSDLGKVAKEVFNKGFSIGSNKLTVKTKTAAGISLSPSFELKNDNLCAAFETSGSPAPGFTLKEKWCSGNVTKTNLVVEDKLAKGLKLDLEVVVNSGNTTLSVTHKVKPWLEATFSNSLNAKTMSGVS